MSAPRRTAPPTEGFIRYEGFEGVIEQPVEILQYGEREVRIRAVHRTHLRGGRGGFTAPDRWLEVGQIATVPRRDVAIPRVPGRSTRAVDPGG